MHQSRQIWENPYRVIVQDLVGWPCSQMRVDLQLLSVMVVATQLLSVMVVALPLLKNWLVDFQYIVRLS